MGDRFQSSCSAPVVQISCSCVFSETNRGRCLDIIRCNPLMKSLANASDCKELRHRLQYARVDSPRRWGKMSAAQMICHLADSFRAVMGEKPWQLDRPTLGWHVVKYLALYAPVRWPRGVPTRPEVDQFLGGTPPLRFEDDV